MVGPTLDELAGPDMRAVLHRARRSGDVVWVEAIGGWLVLSRALAVEVMRDPDGFTVDDPRFTTSQVIGPSMLSLDGDEHRRHRAPFVPPYRRNALAPLEAWLGDEARRIASGLRPARAAELRTALAGPLAARAIHRSLSLVDTDPDDLARWYRAIVTAVSDLSRGRPAAPGADAAMSAIADAVGRTIDRDPDSMSAQILRDGSLDRDEIARNTAIVLFGAIETAEGMIANVLWHLLTHPATLDRVLADPALVPDAVEESLRLEPAAAAVDRYATRGTDLGGASVRAGDLVRVSLSAANTDPAVFDHPDRFDIDRADARLHVTFAGGPHLCIGLLLARLEAVAAVEAVLETMPAVALDARASTPPTGLIFRKPERLVARWG